MLRIAKFSAKDTLVQKNARKRAEKCQFSQQIYFRINFSATCATPSSSLL